MFHLFMLLLLIDGFDKLFSSDNIDPHRKRHILRITYFMLNYGIPRQLWQ